MEYRNAKINLNKVERHCAYEICGMRFLTLDRDQHYHAQKCERAHKELIKEELRLKSYWANEHRFSVVGDCEDCVV